MTIKKRAVTFAVLAVCIVLVTLFFDKNLIVLASFLRNSILDVFFLAITFVSGEIIILFILTALFLWHEHKRRWIIPLWACLGASAVISFVLKIMLQRARPFQLGLVPLIPALQDASFSIWNFSFPSFQSMLVFSAIPILSMQFPKLKKFWIAFAILVAFSRIYFGVHFFSDAVAGAFIGYVIGLLVVKLEKDNKFGQRIYNRIFRK